MVRAPKGIFARLNVDKIPTIERADLARSYVAKVLHACPQLLTPDITGRDWPEML